MSPLEKIGDSPPTLLPSRARSSDAYRFGVRDIQVYLPCVRVHHCVCCAQDNVMSTTTKTPPAYEIHNVVVHVVTDDPGFILDRRASWQDIDFKPVWLNEYLVTWGPDNVTWEHERAIRLQL